MSYSSAGSSIYDTYDKLNPPHNWIISEISSFFFVAEKIELWSHYSTKDTASTPSSQSYDYLGFFALSDNASTDFKSRELQSVLVEPKIGTHLKLRLSCCHPNDLNHTKQVSLIAINVIGFDLDASEFNTHQNGIKNLTELEDYPLVSICDDLSFSMYVEESIADVIREMEIKKQRAIKGSNISVIEFFMFKFTSFFR